MDAKITVNMDNAAFEGSPATELARILRKLAKRIEDTGCDYAPIMDENGNKVGELNISE
jgi:hypothetical protein